MFFVFSARSAFYRTGIVFLFLGAVLELTAFVAPFWAKNGEEHSGLWVQCDKEGSCSNFPLYYKEPNLLNDCDGAAECKCKPNYQITVRSEQECILASWFHAARGLHCFCLVYTFIAVVFAIFVNARRTTAEKPCYSRVVEAVAGCAGVTAFTGSIVYLACLPARLNWSLIVGILAGLVLMVSSGLVAVGNKNIKSSLARHSYMDNSKLAAFRT